MDVCVQFIPICSYHVTADDEQQAYISLVGLHNSNINCLTDCNIDLIPTIGCQTCVLNKQFALWKK